MILGPDGKVALVDEEPNVETAADAYQATGNWWGTSVLDPGLKGGWIEAGGLDKPFTSFSQILNVELNRDLERQAARAAYMINPILHGVIELIHSFVLGTGVSYGETADTKANEAIEDFWFENDMDMMIDRWFKQFIVDGENLTLWPKRNGRGQDGASRIGLYDVNEYLELKTANGLPNFIDSVKVKGGLENDQERTYTENEFVWTAYDSLWNDPRGWPVVMRAVGPALAYVGFANTRLRIHDIQSRINAIYWAFASDDTELTAKAAAYKNLPKSGRVLTMHKLPTGEKEEFEFLETRTNASDSAADGRLVRLILAVALNLPEHYLGEGGEVNRTTADAMGAPAKKAFKRRQQWVRRWLNDIFKVEMRRRHGENARYTVKKYKVNEEGSSVDVSSSRVPIERFEFPWLFPEINDEDAMGLVRRIQLAAEWGLASKQTLSGELGYDYAAELERLPRDFQQQQGEPNQPGGNESGDPSTLNQGVNRQVARNGSASEE